MSKTKVCSLDHFFIPQLTTIDLAITDDHIDKVAAELTQKAKLDSNRCFGYFPALKGRKMIDTNLPFCETFAKKLPNITMNSNELRFNFLRMSLIQQKNTSPYHLDTDAATALTGDISTLHSRQVWRLLINMNDKAPRNLGYLDADPDTMILNNDEGYVHAVDSRAEQFAKIITLPPRSGRTVHAVLFCASKVLHTGKDDKHGHFVAGYGCEEAV